MSFVFPSARVRGNGQNVQTENISVRKINADSVTAADNDNRDWVAVTKVYCTDLV